MKSQKNDILVDFQTGVISQCWLDIYTDLGTKCDGAQTQASVFTSQLWLPYLAFCFDLSGCLQDLHVWSGTVGTKSGKLQYMLQIMTECPLCHGMTLYDLPSPSPPTPGHL